MNAVIVAAALLGLALIDGACSAFRSSVGRDGLVRHRVADIRAGVRGAVLVCGLLLPAVGLAVLSTLSDHRLVEYFRAAGQSMLAVYLPYAGVVLLALAVYGLCGWRQRYLASALILGPLTLVRPVIVLAGAGAASVTVHQFVVRACVLLAVAALLSGEPLADRLWYDRVSYHHSAQTHRAAGSASLEPGTGAATGRDGHGNTAQQQHGGQP